MFYEVVISYNQYVLYVHMYHIDTLKEFGYIFLQDIGDITYPQG